MKIKLKRHAAPFQFDVTNESGQSLQLDSSPQTGGQDYGFRPMETLLASLAGCSAIDIGLILKKQQQEVEDFSVEVTGDRNQESPAKEFTRIHLSYQLKGQLDANKVERAIQLALEKYCSVALSLNPEIAIESAFSIDSNHE